MPPRARATAAGGVSGAGWRPRRHPRGDGGGRAYASPAVGASRNGFFSDNFSGAYRYWLKNGKLPIERRFGKHKDFASGNVKGGKGITVSSKDNFPAKIGGMINAEWLPENARLRNMRPRHEVWNTSAADAERLKSTRRLVDVTDTTEQRRKGMTDGVRLSRALTEELHGWSHTPILSQNWDPQRTDTNPFAQPIYGNHGAPRPVPAPVLEDFPRFYNKEHFAELDHWQTRTNAERYNDGAEVFVYFHFWAHDEDWIHKRRTDVWDYVKEVAREHLTTRLATLQRQLYGCQRDYTAEGKAMRVHLGKLTFEQRIKQRAAQPAAWRVMGDILLSHMDPRLGVPQGAKVQWQTASDATALREEGWWEDRADEDGRVRIQFRITSHEKLLFMRAELNGVKEDGWEPFHVVLEEVRNVEPDGSSNPGAAYVLREKGTATASVYGRRGGGGGAPLPLAPPEDLRRALPGWSAEEVERLYRQELQVFEEELVNTVANLDTMMHPSPVLMACQNELLLTFACERNRHPNGQKDFDWWWHHQSFSLYLPYYDEAFIKRLMNWRSTVNTVIGNSPWRDQFRQYSPQPVNCLMQVWRKHNAVWDSRVFRVDRDTEGGFQEEHLQEWSFVEHRPEPGPPPELRGPPAQPPLQPAEETPAEVRDGTEAARDEAWARLPHRAAPLRGEQDDWAGEYYADTFAARQAAGHPFISPEDQPGVETDVEPELPAAEPSERGKYIRRLGKLYRGYFNPYNPMPVRHQSAKSSSRNHTDWWW